MSENNGTPVPVYAGPDPTQAMVREDFDVVTAEAGVGPDAGEGNPKREAWGDCAADYVSVEPVGDDQLTRLVNGLVARGWTVRSRMTEPVLARSGSRSPTDNRSARTPYGGIRTISVPAGSLPGGGRRAGP
ncbi:hypothetical protein ACFVX6_28215 [Streptomyces sp. NPDC058289]|uniref:hypothetical protein n=1 Tax=Streptomyces sp. NPDC058289 TaxID=3346425 RepID=UPI0036E702A5